MEETEKELLKLFDYYRTKGKDDPQADRCLTEICALLNLEELENFYFQLGRIIQTLRSMKKDLG